MGVGALGLAACGKSGSGSVANGQAGTMQEGGGRAAEIAGGAGSSGAAGALGVAGTALGGVGGGGAGVGGRTDHGGNSGSSAGGGAGGLAAGAGGKAAGGAGFGNPTTCAETVVDEVSKLAPGSLIDGRDGHAYRTVQIGTQLWMAENLSYGARVDGATGQVDDSAVEKYCVDDCDAACDALGGLYTWAEAMGLPSACNQKSCDGITQPQRGICPAAFHLPSTDEWHLLESSVEAEVGQYNAGTALRSTEGWLPDTAGNDGNGTDAYQFRVLPSGLFSSAYLKFGLLGQSTYYWIAYPASGGVTPIRVFASAKRSIGDDTGTKTMGYPVRCLAD
jgi:uncharacterized protein (TIGR02145 family)